MSTDYFEETIALFAQHPQVDCIVLGGSRANGHNDEGSDYDVYIYLNADLTIEMRARILAQTCSYTEMNNTYWETEDDCVLKSGIPLEIIYRNIGDITSHLQKVLVEGQASCGYTTCICYNVLYAKILYDPCNLYHNMVEKFTFPYPERLRTNIIRKNRPLLSGSMPAYSSQIEKAVKRGDFVSVNHRVTEFLASYFDILFAFNKVYHPGEKKLIRYATELCRVLPERFFEDLDSLLNSKSNSAILSAVSSMVVNLDSMLDSANACLISSSPSSPMVNT